LHQNFFTFYSMVMLNKTAWSILLSKWMNMGLLAYFSNISHLNLSNVITLKDLYMCVCWYISWMSVYHWTKQYVVVEQTMVWVLCYDEEASYDIFGYVFSTFLCIWRQISWEMEALSIVWGTYCIIFTRVVVIHFYRRSCNSIGVLSV
jgi:hypothetical protein